MAGLYGKNDQEKRDVLDPIFGSYTSDHALSKYELNKEPVPPEIAYRIVKDQLLDDIQAGLVLIVWVFWLNDNIVLRDGVQGSNNSVAIWKIENQSIAY